MLRTSLLRSTRLFSTTPLVRKTATDTIKDAAKTVDRTISNAAVKGLDKAGELHEPGYLPKAELFSTPKDFC